MITGAHVIVYSRKPEADRAFLCDIIRFRHVDSGDGWLIFALPPSEIAIHPAAKNNVHECYFMCNDIHAFVARMKEQNVRCSRVQTMSWGHLVHVSLPGGGKLGVYEPLHVRPTRTRSPQPRRKRSTKV